MLAALGLGHFLHTIKPINNKVRMLWIAVISCSIIYGCIPLATLFDFSRNIYVIGLLMSINGFLQSYTWPNLLVLVRNYFDPDRYSTLLGFWATCANFGNIIGLLIYRILPDEI